MADGVTQPERAPVKNKSRGCKLVVVLLVVILLGAGATAGYFYFIVWRHAPTAHRHVPVGANVAFRADAAKLLLFKPIREHLWPAIDSPSEPPPKGTAPNPSSPPTAKGRLPRLKDATGIALTDLREIIVASVDAKRWVAVVGGKFPKDRFVSGVHQIIKEDNIPGWTLTEDGILAHKLRLAMGQAEDGTLVFGTDTAIVRRALPAADEDVAVPVPVDGAISFTVNHQAWSGAVGLLPLTIPGMSTLSQVNEVTGTFSLSDQPQLEVVIEPKEGTTAAKLLEDIKSALVAARRLTLLIPHDLAGAKQAMSNAQFEIRNGKVVARTPWSYEAINRVVQALAIAVRTGKRIMPRLRGTLPLPL